MDVLSGTDRHLDITFICALDTPKRSLLNQIQTFIGVHNYKFLRFFQ